MSSSISNRDVVVDAGPVIALARLELLELPGRLFGRALITDIVAEECLANPHHPEHHSISVALKAGELRRVAWSEPPSPTLWSLDPGEASAIALAVSSRATVLVDDRAARRMSRAMNLSIIGTCGLLLVAKQRGFIDAIRPLVETLSESGYYLTRGLIETVCRLAGEP